MICSVGIDLHQGNHRARCLDERAQLCDGFTFQTTPEGLAELEEHIFRDGSNPMIVLEPAGLPWLMVAVYLRSSHPNCHLVKARMQKVAALRRYLRGPVKSDRLDALTLAKMPFIDPEKLIEIYLPPAEIHALQRLTRQRRRMESEVSGHKIRISAILDGYLPGVRRAFGEAWSSSFRAFLRARINPFAVVRSGEKALHTYLSKTGPEVRCRPSRFSWFVRMWRVFVRLRRPKEHLTRSFSPNSKTRWRGNYDCWRHTSLSLNPWPAALQSYIRSFILQIT